MAGESYTTTDHETIKRWAEARGGRPATVKGTPADQQEAGVLRIDFSDAGAEENLEPIPWESFFDTFEERDLAFLYQEETRSGGISRFSRFISRESH